MRRQDKQTFLASPAADGSHSSSGSSHRPAPRTAPVPRPRLRMRRRPSHAWRAAPDGSDAGALRGERMRSKLKRRVKPEDVLSIDTIIRKLYQWKETVVAVTLIIATKLPLYFIFSSFYFELSPECRRGNYHTSWAFTVFVCSNSLQVWSLAIEGPVAGTRWAAATGSKWEAAVVKMWSSRLSSCFWMTIQPLVYDT